MPPSTPANRRVRPFVLLGLVLLASSTAAVSLAAGVAAVHWSTSLGSATTASEPLAGTEPAVNVTDDGPGGGVTETVDDTTDGANETVDDTTDSATETADDATGAVTETVDDATDRGETATGAVNDTLGTVESETGNATGTLDSSLDGTLAGAGTVGLNGEATTTTDGAAKSGDGSATSGTSDAPSLRRTGAASGGKSGSRRGGGLPQAAGGVVVLGVGTATGALLLHRSVGASAWRLAAPGRALLPAFEPGEWLRWLAGVAGYSRYDDSDPLRHDTRRTFYARIQDAPGVHLSALSSEVDVPMSTARHHLRVLEAEGVVQSIKIRGKRCYFPPSTDRPALEAALTDGTQVAVLETLALRERATVSELADELDLDASTVTYQLQRLEAADLVVRRRDGRQVWNRLAPHVEPFLEGEFVDPATD